MLLLFMVFLALPVTAREFLQPLTNAADIISLPVDQAARHFPVTVTGVVTAADPAFHGRFFLQDATSGVFVDNANGQRPEPGELLQVTGVTDAGAYAPILSTPQIRQLGTGPLPEAKPVSIERLMAGAEDSQRIEIGGIVRAARTDATHLILDLASGGYRFRVLAPLQPNAEPAALVAAQVRVRGTAAEAHNRSLRQLVFPEVYVPRFSDFVVERAESADPFTTPVVPLASLAQYRRDSSFDRRVHIKGVVTLQRLGESLFVQDAAGALQVQSRELITFSPGDAVEAVGFPSFENFLPVLQDALFRPATEPSHPVVPKASTLEEIQNGFHHAQFISFRGKLIDRTSGQAPRGPAPAQTRTSLVLQSGDAIFAAEIDELQGRTEMAALPIGSTLEISGVCLTEIDSEGKMKSFRLLVGNPQNVLLVAQPSWFTPQHLLISLGFVLAALVVIVTWTVMITRRNSVLRFLIREREKAQLELQQAHDQLEERVKERTTELKFQITARKESELQFKGVLAERTRLAQELHDTVEQTLTGIALQLDTAAKLYERSPDSALHHLELARNLMAKSQVEVRRSVWDLRCRALQQFDLSGALMGEARQMTNGTNLRVELETKGQTRPLPEVVEENLLRIGQEALTNVLKHSKATLAQIELNFDSDQISLQIQDNGKGFSPDVALGPNDGHFGLLGMAERVKRLNGRFHVRSAPGHGATVRAEIPVEAPKPSVPVPNYEPLPTSSISV